MKNCSVSTIDSDDNLMEIQLKSKMNRKNLEGYENNQFYQFRKF